MLIKQNSHIDVLNEFAKKYSLTPREVDIISVLLQNIVNTREISEKLSISTYTVRNHFENIFKKTNCENKCDVALLLYNLVIDKLQGFSSFAKVPKVLVIDDTVEFTEGLDRELSGHGLAVEVSNDPLEALDKIKKNRYDCVVCDVRMPGMDGRELLFEIKRIFPAWPNVILMSGYSDYSQEDLLDIGAIDFISKPFAVESLFKIIRNYYVEDLDTRNRMLTDESDVIAVIKSKINLEKSSIGRGGVYVPLDQYPRLKKCDVGGTYDFKFAAENIPGQIRVTAEVEWKRTDGEEPGIGLRFLTLTPHLDHYMKQHVIENKITSFIPAH
jgi:DNA-binding NarL/FixJ family response regulator